MRRMTTAAVAFATTSALSISMLAGALEGTAQANTGATSGAASRGHHARFTDYALRAAGFGSRATGGQVPSSSDDTAFMAVGCSTRLGINRENHEAEATIPGAGKATDVRTDIWTRGSGDNVSTYTRNTIQKLVVAQSGMGSIRIRGISSLAHAWHDGKGFHSEATTEVGSIQLVPPGGGDPQDLGLPSPGQPIEVPGVATISLGKTKERVHDDGALAQANALVISKTASDSRSKISQAKAQALDGAKHGTFHGYSAASEARAADGNITSGRTPLSLMPCQGSGGEVWKKEASDSDLDGNAVATGLKTALMAKAFPAKSVGYERGAVAHFALGGGQLDIDGIIGKANVVRDGNKVTRSISGSKIGTITANGEEQEFPDTGVLEIPGVAKLERFVVDKSKNGLHVIALRVTLLDGTGAVYNLGQAQMLIRRH